MNYSVEVMLNEQDIKARVKAIAAQISHDYQHKNLLLVGLLKGSFIFMADLCREITVPHQLEFMTVSSYGSATQSSGEVNIIHDMTESIENKHVIIVEDIIDSGHTLAKIKTLLQLRQPASLQICTLIDKPSRREIDVEVKYIGFAIADQFIVGYGLDYEQFYRHLPYIGIVNIA